MKIQGKLSAEIINFLERQNFVIVTTIDASGFPHNACKGIVKIEGGRRIYLLDLYLAKTFENLKRNASISITAVDEHRFIGYAIKGRAKVLDAGHLKPNIIKAWEDKMTSRIAHRLLKNIRGEKGHPRHPESLLPAPQYIIALDAEEIIDLTPQHLHDKA